MFTIPEIRIGEPIRHQALTVFPLFTNLEGQVDYLLSDEAIQVGSVKVQEVPEGGSVTELLVENNCDTKILFLEGEELLGAKQNRILNTTILLPARAKIKVPVSCVEQGRWAYKSRHFGLGGQHSPSKLRHILKGSVSASLLGGAGHRSDQGKIWEEIHKQQAKLGVLSRTSAMADTFAAYKKQIDEMASQFKYPEGAAGLVVVLGEKVVALDLFDKPATCRKVWQRLLPGFILEAIEPEAKAGSVMPSAVERALTAFRNSSWEQVQPVGDGQEYRAGSKEGMQASALTFGDSLVHGSLVTGE